MDDLCIFCSQRQIIYRKKKMCRNCYDKERGVTRWKAIKADPEKHQEYKNYTNKKARERRTSEDVRERERNACKKWYSKNLQYRSEYYKKYYYSKRMYHLLRVRIREYGENYIKALIRDDFKCVGCGVSEYGKRRLHIHHIDGNGSQLPASKQNNNLDNLITLCPLCHRKSENERKQKQMGRSPKNVRCA